MKLGNSPRGDPVEGRERPGQRTVYGKDVRHVEVKERLNETETDSGTGETGAGYGDERVALHGLGVVQGGLSVDTERWSYRDRRANGRRLRRISGCKSRDIAQRGEGWNVPSSGGETGLYPERGPC
jgi:hypothetical protein